MTLTLGTNLPAATSGSRTFYFANLFRQRDTWGPADAPYLRNCPVDDAGDPTADCGVYLVEGMDVDPVAIPPGDYTLIFDGTATVRGPGQVLDQTVTDGVTRATIRVPDTAALPPDRRVLNFTLSFADARRPDGTPGIRNPRLYLPGHGPGDVYNKRLIDVLRGFRIARWMDTVSTNLSLPATWPGRVKPDGWQGGAAGMAWEHVFRISRAAGVDCWINVPAQATPYYVEELAELAKAELAPTQRLYVEYSNEVWNEQFPQCWINRQAAADAGGYEYPGDINPGNQVYWGFRRIASETAAIADTFRRVFGRQAMGERVRIVLGHQIMWPDQLPDMLRWYRHTIGEPSKDIWGVASGVYLNIGELEKSDDLTHEQIVATLRERLPELEAHVAEASRIADEWMLMYGAYELGIHLTGAASLPQKIASQSTEDIGDVVAEVVAMFGRHADFACWYTLSSPHSQNGCWSLTNAFLADSEKLDAALTAAKGGEMPYAPPAVPVVDGIASVRIEQTAVVTYASGRVERVVIQ